ncbi:hypothetical protein F5X68DRAFT_30861 [Plectosphaerella plurivora]|uniref:Uncharacterized protein n=1 Tax=Plectosphaerella plurivora TaxID=936078 RepID=A0A9P8VMT6_9PEZI|nr:hypothetical protein F5X68DRAFT_30861 [Plectosphaerella plurivora]
MWEQWHHRASQSCLPLSSQLRSRQVPVAPRSLSVSSARADVSTLPAGQATAPPSALADSSGLAALFPTWPSASSNDGSVTGLLRRGKQPQPMKGKKRRRGRTVPSMLTCPSAPFFGSCSPAKDCQNVSPGVVPPSSSSIFSAAYCTRGRASSRLVARRRFILMDVRINAIHGASRPPMTILSQAIRPESSPKGGWERHELRCQSTTCCDATMATTSPSTAMPVLKILATEALDALISSESPQTASPDRRLSSPPEQVQDELVRAPRSPVLLCGVHSSSPFWPFSTLSTRVSL